MRTGLKMTSFSTLVEMEEKFTDFLSNPLDRILVAHIIGLTLGNPMNGPLSSLLLVVLIVLVLIAKDLFGVGLDWRTTR